MSIKWREGNTILLTRCWAMKARAVCFWWRWGGDTMRINFSWAVFRERTLCGILGKSWMWSCSLIFGLLKLFSNWNKSDLTCVHTCAQSFQTFCSPMNYSLPDFSVHRILQARILEWVALPSPGNLPNPGIEPESPVSSALEGGFFITAPPGKPIWSEKETSNSLIPDTGPPLRKESYSPVSLGCSQLSCMFPGHGLDGWSICWLLSWCLCYT